MVSLGDPRSNFASIYLCCWWMQHTAPILNTFDSCEPRLYRCYWMNLNLGLLWVNASQDWWYANSFESDYKLLLERCSNLSSTLNLDSSLVRGCRSHLFQLVLTRFQSWNWAVRHYFKLISLGLFLCLKLSYEIHSRKDPVLNLQVIVIAVNPTLALHELERSRKTLTWPRWLSRRYGMTVMKSCILYTGASDSWWIVTELLLVFWVYVTTWTWKSL